MTRPAKPVQLQLIQGNPNKLTKAHIEDRKKAEIKIGDNIFIASDRLRSDKKAIARWNEIITIFAETGIEFITSSDSGFIERYCLLYSYHNELLETKKEIDSKK